MLIHPETSFRNAALIPKKNPRQNSDGDQYFLKNNG